MAMVLEGGEDKREGVTALQPPEPLLIDGPEAVRIHMALGGIRFGARLIVACRVTMEGGTADFEREGGLEAEAT